jgi:hypothetical protein
MPAEEMPLSPVFEPLDFSRLMAFAVLAVGALWVLFLVLTIVRYWSARTQKREAATGGLDLCRLERQRDAGEISQEEYERIRGTLTEARPSRGTGAAGTEAKVVEPEEKPPERPINLAGGPDERPGRSEANGQG